MIKQVDNYALEKKIGSGNYGEVYQGYNKLDGRKVAVKVMKRELLTGKFLELLANEVQILKSCHNDNIVQLYDMKKTHNNIYMVYEYCNEGDMSEYLRKKGHLSEEEAVKYFNEILNGFKTLVKHNVIHRDFKLANILKHNGSLKISDFGFSKLMAKCDLTQTLIGSPLNMAPEIIEGLPYNSKADIWSLGVVFYEMLFGKPPYFGTNIFEILREAKSTKLEIPRDVNNISKEAEDILKKMLKIKPNERIEWRELFEHKITQQPKHKTHEKMNSIVQCYNLRKTFSMSAYWWLTKEQQEAFLKMDEQKLEVSFTTNGTSDQDDTASSKSSEKFSINVSIAKSLTN